jgi:hypothetical protein
MKKYALTAVLIFVLAVCAAADGPAVTVVNGTGYDIYFLYISKSDTEDWEEDVLGDDILEDGDSVRITLPSAGLWDIMAEDEDEDTYTRFEVNVQSDVTLEITLDDLD